MLKKTIIKEIFSVMEGLKSSQCTLTKKFSSFFFIYHFIFFLTPSPNKKGLRVLESWLGSFKYSEFLSSQLQALIT